MKPTRCPAARRIAVRHAPVEPLPFVPAINAPFRPRSGPPRRSRIARVRAVPSFIAKRPCFEMKSRASWYVKALPSGGDGCDPIEVGVHRDGARQAGAPRMRVLVIPVMDHVAGHLSAIS